MKIAVRLRGVTDIRWDTKATLEQMQLAAVNNAALFSETPANLGMLRKIKDYATWGDVSVDALATILPRALDDKALAEHKFKSYNECAEALIGGKVTPKELGFRRIRLHPARKGLRTIKRPYKTGGDLGNRGDAINELLVRMR